MNASYTWLRDFTEFDMSPEALRDMITARVATVDDLVPLRQDLAGIVVGRVISARPHPDSDHLWLTRVDAGLADAELLDVVCGAPNVREGARYPFAPVGAVLPGGLRIERRRIRGQTSSGMLCSARELDLGGDHSGILELETDAAPGTPLLAALRVGDTRLVVDVLPNRPDLLAHEGLAREVAALTGNPLRQPLPADMAVPDVPIVEAHHSATTAGVRVSVDADSECPLYIAVVIRGVRVAPSPDWLASRLGAVGVRPISNVVDVTNYMLHGFGQPMHAFDLGRIAGREIRVRRAHDGETLTTLDGVHRRLTSSMTVIADAERAQAVAGVIGGEGSEVTETTTDVLLEVAVFAPGSVRRTRRTLGISTDASYRFERLVDSARSRSLALYAAGLVRAVAGGEIDGDPVLIGSPAAPHSPVRLRMRRVAQLLGDSVGVEECEQLLTSIGFHVAPSTGDSLAVSPPSWRPDVTAEVDLVEEIARLRGYDSFPNELRPFRVGTTSDSPEYTLMRRVAQAMVAAGLLEVRPIPFVGDAGQGAVRVINPLAESEAMLRSSALQTLARRVEYNLSHMVRNVRLFELGVVFRSGDGAIPAERTVAAAAIGGDRYPAHFTEPRPPQVDLWDGRALGERVVRAAFGDAGAVEFVASAQGDGWSLVRGGAIVGSVGPLLVDAPVWAPTIYGIELDLGPALVAEPERPLFRPLPSAPAAEFDLALLLPRNITAADVRRVVANAAGELLEALEPFDEFTGSGVPEGYRSVAWRVTLRDPDRTLRDREIEGRRGRILKALDEELGVRPRAA